MNSQEIYIIESKRMLDHSINYRPNTVKIHTQNTLAHELAKFLVAWDLMNNGSTIITEATFKHLKGRADIFELDTRTAYEILNSETIERFNAKKEYYPFGVTIVGLKAEDVLAKHLKGLKWKK
jgi:hypothetical protein